MSCGHFRAPPCPLRASAVDSRKPNTPASKPVFKDPSVNSTRLAGRAESFARTCVVHWNHVIKAFPAKCSDHSLAESIRERRPKRSLQDRQQHVLDGFVECPREDRIAVVDEPPVVVLPRQSFTELLERPLGRWIGRDVGMQDSAAPDLHDYEDVEHLKTRRHGCGEITRGDCAPQKCRPGTSGRRRAGSEPETCAHGCRVGPRASRYSRILAVDSSRLG